MKRKEVRILTDGFFTVEPHSVAQVGEDLCMKADQSVLYLPIYLGLYPAHVELLDHAIPR